MARFALAIALFAALMVPAVLASTGPQTGPFVGSVADGGRNSHSFSTHGNNPCLAVYLPKLYVVTLTYTAPTDTLTLSAAGEQDAGSNGVASVSFVANYCTAFSILVQGTDVADKATYAVTVESVFLGGEPALA